jgi:uncharacterized protein YjiS (DUF1127 family)
MMKNLTRSIVSIFGKKVRNPEEVKIKQAITALKTYSDRELADIGISRSEIENAVRFGKPANDSNLDQNTAA